jgi:hypothetical protein
MLKDRYCFRDLDDFLYFVHQEPQLLGKSVRFNYLDVHNDKITLRA